MYYYDDFTTYEQDFTEESMERYLDEREVYTTLSGRTTEDLYEWGL